MCCRAAAKSGEQMGPPQNVLAHKRGERGGGTTTLRCSYHGETFYLHAGIRRLPQFVRQARKTTKSCWLRGHDERSLPCQTRALQNCEESKMLCSCDTDKKLIRPIFEAKRKSTSMISFPSQRAVDPGKEATIL